MKKRLVIIISLFSYISLSGEYDYILNSIDSNTSDISTDTRHIVDSSLEIKNNIIGIADFNQYTLRPWMQYVRDEIGLHWEDIELNTADSALHLEDIETYTSNIKDYFKSIAVGSSTAPSAYGGFYGALLNRLLPWEQYFKNFYGDSSNVNSKYKNFATFADETVEQNAQILSNSYVTTKSLEEIISQSNLVNNVVSSVLTNNIHTLTSNVYLADIAKTQKNNGLVISNLLAVISSQVAKITNTTESVNNPSSGLSGNPLFSLYFDYPYTDLNYDMGAVYPDIYFSGEFYKDVPVLLQCIFDSISSLQIVNLSSLTNLQILVNALIDDEGKKEEIEGDITDEGESLNHQVDEEISQIQAEDYIQFKNEFEKFNNVTLPLSSQDVDSLSDEITLFERFYITLGETEFEIDDIIISVDKIEEIATPARHIMGFMWWGLTFLIVKLVYNYFLYFASKFVQFSSQAKI